MFDKKLCGKVFFALLLVTLFLINETEPVKAAGTIYIRADGSIDPPTASIFTADNITYTLTASIDFGAWYGIIIERSNIVLNGAGFSLRGANQYRGIYLWETTNVTVRNIIVTSFAIGIELWHGSSNNVVDSLITASTDTGIYLYTSSSNSITGNVIINSSRGIDLWFSSNSNIISGNSIVENNNWGIYAWTSSCYNTILGNNITANGEGIVLHGGNYSSIMDNHVERNLGKGIDLAPSSGSEVCRNQMVSNDQGMRISNSVGVSILDNRMESNRLGGIALDDSSNVSLSGNEIVGNGANGIYVDSSTQVTITGNSIMNNAYGVYFYISTGNQVYHNSFVNNTVQVYWPYWVNYWDNGYPSGGNYWSDYTGVDFYAGATQNELGNDAIGDTPYVIGEENKDRYPLMIPHDAVYTCYDWPMFHHGPRHTGYSDSIAPENNRTLWTREISAITASPAAANDKIFAGSLLGDVFALNATTGALVWQTHLGENLGAYSSPAVGFDKVFVGYTMLDLPGTGIWALNESSGEEVWNYTMEGDAYSPQHIALTVAENAVFIGPLGDNTVRALNATTGELIWSYSTGGSPTKPNSNPVVINNTLFVGSPDFNLYALNATTGAHIWNFTSEDSILSSPAVSCDMVFTTSQDGRLYALNQTDGNLLWSSPVTSPLSSPAVTFDLVVVGSEAFNVTTGNLVWSNSIGETDSSPAIADNKVIIVTGSGLSALNLASGEEIWSYQTGLGKADFSTPVVAYGKVFAGFGDTLYAFGVHDVSIKDLEASKSIVGQGYTLSLNATTSNLGGYTEAFNVTIYANETILKTFTDINLSSANSAVLTFTWNTTGFAKGNYTIKAYAVPVEGEMDLLDNNCTYAGLVVVTIAGDVTSAAGPPEGKVDMRDIALLCTHFMRTPSHPGWDPNIDVNDDGVVNMRDISIACSNFGKPSP